MFQNTSSENVTPRPAESSHKILAPDEDYQRRLSPAHILATHQLTLPLLNPLANPTVRGSQQVGGKSVRAHPVMSGVGIQKSKETETKETNGELEDYNGMWFYNGGRALVVKRGSTEKHVRTEI